MSKELDKELGGAKMKLNYKDKFQPFFYWNNKRVARAAMTFITWV
jgi:hypothetical protein